MTGVAEKKRGHHVERSETPADKTADIRLLKD